VSWVQSVQAVQAVQNVWNDLNLNGWNSAEHQAVHARMTASFLIVATVIIQLADERPSLQIDQRLFDLLFRVHNERAVSRNRFVQRFAGNQ
jgi:hypothetical protein